MNSQLEMFSDNPEYDAFVEKFKPKKTTDDCYTPPLVYEVVKDWACETEGMDPYTIARLFSPGGDHNRAEYPRGCVGLDTPPFSILARICKFYLDREIPFFLFAPSLTAFSGRDVVMRMNHIICGASIVYENGAVVSTSFGGDMIAQTAPELTRRINRAVETIRRETVRELPKYVYPDNVVTAAMLQRYAKYGIDFSVLREECCFIPKLDSQREAKKSIYGGGLLVNSQKAAERAAAERATPERAAAHVWQLSDREREMVLELDSHGSQ